MVQRVPLKFSVLLCKPMSTEHPDAKRPEEEFPTGDEPLDVQLPDVLLPEAPLTDENDSGEADKVTGGLPETGVLVREPDINPPVLHFTKYRIIERNIERIFCSDATQKHSGLPEAIYVGMHVRLKDSIGRAKYQSPGVIKSIKYQSGGIALYVLLEGQTENTRVTIQELDYS